MIALKVIFSGSVQGVGFRYTVARIAERYEVSGYVKNRMDGKVEMLAQGSRQEVDDFIDEIESYMSGHIREKSINKQTYDPGIADFGISF